MKTEEVPREEEIAQLKDRVKELSGFLQDRIRRDDERQSELQKRDDLLSEMAEALKVLIEYEPDENYQAKIDKANDLLQKYSKSKEA